MAEQKDPEMQKKQEEKQGAQEAGQEDEQEVEQEAGEQYSFLQETIKDEAGGRKRRIAALKLVGSGLVIGLFASLSFAACKPWFEKQFQNNPKEVTIPKEEEPEEGEDKDDQEEAPQAVMDADSYRELNQVLNAIAQEASKSVVEITGIGGEEDWTDSAYDRKNSICGVIVADNGQHLLIFGKTTVLKDSNELTATFPDGKTYKAELRKRDANLGLGIYAVLRTDIQDSTWPQIKTAVLGSSNATAKGETAIAVGKPFGYAGGAGCGIVSSTKNVLDNADGQYKLICTDIAAADNGSGIIVNLEGEVIAIIDQDISEESSMNLITGYGISDLKSEIQLLTERKAVPYAGIRGINVTESIALQGIPEGVYVKRVDADSPAMEAGIQSGDVITSIDGTKVTSIAGYHAVLSESSVGEKIKLTGQRRGAGGSYVDIDFTITVGSKE